MTAPRVTAYTIPTGGAVGIQFETVSSGNIVLQRATSGASGLSAWETLYSGQPLTETGVGQFYLDVGDLLPGPLRPETVYVYRVTDVSGTTASSGMLPAARLVLENDPLEMVLVRLLQGGINNLTVPASGRKAQVLQAMPIAGFPPMPFVVINNDLTQQSIQSIGEDVELPSSSNIWLMNEIVKRVWRISVMSTSSQERDYYRDAVIAFFKMGLAYAFAPIGQNIEHDWQATSYQIAKETDAMVPGFYGADVLLTMTGTFNLKIITSYGRISTITANVSAAPASGTTPVTITATVTG